MKAPYLIRIFASLLVMGQVMLVPVAAYAETLPSESPAASETPAPSESPSPSVSVSPEPSPSPSASPLPSEDPTPSPSESPAVISSSDPSPSPSDSPTADARIASPTGPTAPTGPTGPTGIIPKYALDSNTKTWVLTDQSSFTWDPKSGYWLSPLYQYDPASGYYRILIPGQAVPANFLTAPGTVNTPLGLVAPGSQKYELARSLGLLPDSMAIGTTGPGSTNSIGSNTSNGVTFDLTNLVNVINAITSNATSGDATASGNTQAGDVSTGSAAVVANLVNLLSSAWSWSNGALNYFVNNIFGNKTGDLTFKPTVSTTGGGGLGQASIGTTGANSDNSISSNADNDLTVRQSDTANITNNLDLDAISGDAAASGNTSAGNATSGDAIVEANIINLINSYINSGDSFFGILNLFGNLNGDILFPTGFLDSVYGTNASRAASSIGMTGPDSTNSIAQATNNTADINATTDNSIRNNIDANAQSGNADVSGNTMAGSATTGDAKTSQALYNLSNTNIFGDNAVLVIVNVMGRWIGHIMNMPNMNGTTSALLTGGSQIDTTGPNSTNSIDQSTNNTANIDVNKTGTITNNIDANAQSGDATLTSNTQAGDAKTGSAKVATNVANIINSGINVKRWFGVLVINVFGNWLGSVGDNTSAGNVETAGKGSGNTTTSARATTTDMPRIAAVVTTTNSTNGHNSTDITASSSGSSVGTQSTTNDSVNVSNLAAIQQPIASKPVTKSAPAYALFGFSILAMLIAAGLAFYERRYKQI